MLEYYQNIPLGIDPIAFSIGFLHVRWYSLLYILGFFVTFLVLNKSLLNSEFKKDAQIQILVIDYLLITFFAALLGGRLGYILFYDLKYFLQNPLSAVSPFQDGTLVGFYGMSYHGALIAIIVASYFFLKSRKIKFFFWADIVALAVPVGYFFGRIGNFLNGELYGRVTDSFLGMRFQSDPGVLRHPSQLYEALLEGLLLFLILWKVKKFKFAKGTVFASYIIGYGAFRFVAEWFREPDFQIGFVQNNLTLGQIFSLAMVVIGLILLQRLNSRHEFKK